MIKHIISGITEGFRNRKKLRQLLDSTPASSTILDLSPGDLKAAGILALALDYDGVLAPHGGDRPLPEIEEWIRGAITVFSGKIYLFFPIGPMGQG